MLNLRTEVAHTPVSRLGKIFKITFFPVSYTHLDVYKRQTLDLFQKMNSGEIEEGAMVLRAKIDMASPNMQMCIRDRGIENVIPLSDFRFSDFDENYGVRMADGPLAGLLARSVVVIVKDGKIAYTELVPEITQEPDYDKAIAAVK